MAELKNDASELALEEALRLWNRFREWWNAVVALIAVSEYRMYESVRVHR